MFAVVVFDAVDIHRFNPYIPNLLEVFDFLNVSRISETKMFNSHCPRASEIW